MLLKDIKKLEYRTDPDGAEVVDFLYDDNTKVKILVSEFTEKLAEVDSQIEALRRTRRIMLKVTEIIELNRGKAEAEQVIDPKLIP